MTLPTSPPINLLQICEEFGAPAGTPLTSFYRGGPYVPDVAQNANVPTSGAISLLNLLGATRYTPISVVVTQSGGEVFRNESAPRTERVSGDLTPAISGGSGSYSVSWQYLSGGNFPQYSQTGNIVSGSSVVTKDSSDNMQFRLTVSDGVSTFQHDYGLDLSYWTDL